MGDSTDERVDMKAADVGSGNPTEAPRGSWAQTSPLDKKGHEQWYEGWMDRGTLEAEVDSREDMPEVSPCPKCPSLP